VQQNLGAARLIFIDAHGRVAAAAGDASLDEFTRGYTSARLIAAHGQLYSLVSVTVGAGNEPAGRLPAAEALDAQTLSDWSDLCGAAVTLGPGDPSSGETLVFPVRSVETTWLRVESRMDAETAALARSRGLLFVAGAIALAGALAASLVLSRGLAE